MNNRLGCVVITGAARGIGAAIAAEFLKGGRSVALLDVDGDAVTARTQFLTQTISRTTDVLGWSCDISDRSSVERVAMEIIERWGRVDVLVNNAGLARAVPFLEVSDEDWHKVVSVNLYGTFLCSQIFGRHMVRNGQGVIICMGSTNGLRGQERLAPYNASKAGVISLVQTMAVEFAPFGVRTVAICPGPINTQLEKDEGFGEQYLERLISEKVPLKRWGRPDEIGAVCVFLASESAAYITGQTLVVDGGLICHQ